MFCLRRLLASCRVECNAPEAEFQIPADTFVLYTATMAYTAPMIRIAICVLVCVAIIGCGPQRQVKSRTSVASDGDNGSFILRFNPCQCLLHSDELSTEIRNDSGWERVALQASEDTPGIVRSLVSQMRDNPNGLYRVEGELLSRLVQWNGRHQSRVLRVSSVRPLAQDRP